MIRRKRFMPALLLIGLAHVGLAVSDARASPLAVDFLDGYLELGVRGRNDRRNRPSAGTDVSKDQVKLEELLHLDSAGFVWYPRLLRYRASLDLQFIQPLNGGSNLFLPGGGLWLNFLEKKPYGLNLFARVVENEIEESFARNYESRLWTYGGALRFLLGPLPFRLRYTHRFQERTGDSVTPNRELEEKVDEVEFMGNYRLHAGSDGDIRYVYSDQKLRGRRSKRHDFVANNVTFFDPERRKRLTGLVRYYDWSGRTDTSEGTVSGTFDWQHTPRLSTSYHLDYAHRTFDNRSSDLYNFRSNVSHQLFSSLSSSAGVFASFQDASGGDIGDYGGEIVESYTKRLGRWGRLGVGVSPFVRVQQLRPDGGTAFVLDERVIFPPSDRALLRRFDIEVDSIVVTSTDGATLYEEDFDYRVSEVNRRTELQRVASGSIPAGGTVLVDYRYQARDDNDVMTYGVRSDVDWSYRDWGSVFANVTVKREDVISGRSDRRLDDRDRQEIGVRTSQRWINALISFDWEKWGGRRSDGNLQTVLLSTPWPGRFRGALTVTHRGRDFTNPGEQLEEWRVLGNLDVQLGRNGMLEFDPEYANENWDGTEGTDGRDLESMGGTLALRWSFRSLEFRGSAAVYYVVRTGVRGLHDHFFFRVRRYF